METAIFHAGNASLYFYRNGTGLMIDAIYDGSMVGMSAMPELWRTDLQQHKGVWQNVDGLFFTHRHPDHYEERLTSEFLQRAADLKRTITAYAPEWERSNAEVHELENGMRRIRVGCADIIARTTVHDGGEPWNRDPHETFLIKMGNETFFVSGDGKLDAEDARAFLRYAYHIDIAFVNLYQLGSEQGMECIHTLDADRVMLYHLPRPEDDICHYRMMAVQAMDRFLNRYGEETEIAEHMKWIGSEKVL